MAAPIFKTPAEWAASIGSLSDPKIQLMLEIYNQLKAIAP